MPSGEMLKLHGSLHSPQHQHPVLHGTYSRHNPVQLQCCATLKYYGAAAQFCSIHRLLRDGLRWRLSPCGMRFWLVQKQVLTPDLRPQGLVQELCKVLYLRRTSHPAIQASGRSAWAGQWRSQQSLGRVTIGIEDAGSLEGALKTSQQAPVPSNALTSQMLNIASPHLLAPRLKQEQDQELCPAALGCSSWVVLMS